MKSPISLLIVYAKIAENAIEFVEIEKVPIENSLKIFEKYSRMSLEMQKK